MTKNNSSFFIQGPVTPQMIAESISHHSRKKQIGAHDIFLGQVRADAKDGRTVTGIHYTCYESMAQQKISEIREEVIIRFQLSCAHILHSLGTIASGELCLFVFVSSPHRSAAIDACRELVERIKSEVPVFGKEIFDNDTYSWKVNTEA